MTEFPLSGFRFSEPKFDGTAGVAVDTCCCLESLASLYLLSLPPAETSKVDYVLFQAATALMESVVREWILLEKTSIESLRAFLLTYVLQRPK